MPGFTSDNVEQIVAACRENISAIAESLNLCIDRQDRIEIGGTTVWSAESVPAELDGPGLAVTLTVTGQSMLCLIPASYPLPEWYTHPGESEEARLQTLAMEWSMNLLPAELEAENFQSVAVENLRQIIVDSDSPDEATILELRARSSEVADDDAGTPTAEETSETADAGGEQSEEDDKPAAETEDGDAATTAGDARSRLFLIWPVTNPALPTEQLVEAAAETAVPQNQAETGFPADAPQPAVPAGRGLSMQARQVLGLPVTVVVRLAEKKVELGQLLSLTPGFLLTFNKPCEDLLDLYVNNQRYCQGEAVKIGEKFGLKITQVGVVDERTPHIL